MYKRQVKKLEGYIGLVTKEKNLAGLDKSRPWGVLVTLGESDDPIIHGYVPVTDLKQLVASIPTPDGEALTPDANGVYEIDAEGRKMCIRDRAPPGAKEVSFAPPGLESAMVLVSQGLVPLAIGFRPSGTCLLYTSRCV